MSEGKAVHNLKFQLTSFKNYVTLRDRGGLGGRENNSKIFFIDLSSFSIVLEFLSIAILIKWL